MAEHENERRAEKWHVGKEVPIAVVVFLIGQTFGYIWFAATQTAQLGTLTALMKEFKEAQYTLSDARRDQEHQAARSMNNSRRIDEMVRRVEVLENSRKFSNQ